MLTYVLSDTSTVGVNLMDKRTWYVFFFFWMFKSPIDKQISLINK